MDDSDDERDEIETVNGAWNSKTVWGGGKESLYP